MPLPQLVILAAVIANFALFGVALLAVLMHITLRKPARPGPIERTVTPARRVRFDAFTTTHFHPR